MAALSKREGYRGLSLWHDTSGEAFEPRPRLPGNREVDVAIVGAGYTGLWTAYYLKRADPSVRVCVIEREVAGFGASGRNGGWCSSLFASPREKLAELGGRSGAVAMQRAMFETVSEVGRVAGREGIDCDYRRGGCLLFARNPSQQERLRTEVESERSWGFGEDDYRWLPPEEAARRIGVRGNLGALFTPHCARVHPAKLVRGLARAVERLGVPIYEHTDVTEIGAGRAWTPQGVVAAEVVVRATESFTVELPGKRRSLLPVYSLMVATEPLGPELWEAIGWEGEECWSDGRHLLVYLSRTADGRIALGGRGAPYHFGSRMAPRFDRDERVAAMLRRALAELLPETRKYRLTHHWGGAVALPRDWVTSVGLDRSSGLGWAGGYVGDGVSTTNLAGRTLADLILRRESELVHLPWVGHHSRRWEPEPLRWLGVSAVTKGLADQDKAEERGRAGSPLFRLTERLAGRPGH